MKAFIKFIVLILIGVAGIFLSAYTTQSLWQWFVSEPFNVALISLPLALGIGVLVRWFTMSHQVTAKKFYERDEWKDSADEIAASVLSNLIVPGSVLLTGWVIHHYV